MKNELLSNWPANIRLAPVGIIHSRFRQAKGTPIQPSMAGGSEGTVEVFEEFSRGLKDLDGFERVWLLYWLHRASPHKLLVIPYLDTQERGLFATRAPARPNPIGISAVRLLRIEGNILTVADVDILDGTPLLDIKPYAPQFDCFEVKKCGWLDEHSANRRVADERFEKDGRESNRRNR